ncbi:hypothetical protein HBB16_03175 [Pseudonocardia sp. MCCB 268]|nr:hypothetical protein [Pseudonocardia cytotoxica]
MALRDLRSSSEGSFALSGLVIALNLINYTLLTYMPNLLRADDDRRRFQRRRHLAVVVGQVGS